MKDLPMSFGTFTAVKNKRLNSIDLLRGTVMIIMALDHVRDYFHKDAFLYSPTDLTQTSVVLFFTRFITHYCAPVFVFLAGVSAYLYGAKRSKRELAFFLFTRGLWLVIAEIFIVTLGWTFNPTYHIVNLQVIWAIGISMIVLSALVYLDIRYILLVGLLIIAGHNLLDTIHVPGTGLSSVLWTFVHDPKEVEAGGYLVVMRYPVLAWIGVMATGYCFGTFYAAGYDAAKRRKILLNIGLGAIALFILLRSGNWYGDAAHWSVQKNAIFTFLSFINVTKYPPSLLYVLITIGPALVFLSLTERPLNKWADRITIFGRVPMCYYLLHIYLIHILALFGVAIAGYNWTDMTMLSNRVNRVQALQGYGFNLGVTYIIWIAVVLILFPICKWYNRYKSTHQASKWWLSYL
jgi:uncharacterized membrane protein